MNKTDRIYVAGHTGLIGSAMVRRLSAECFSNLLLVSHADLDLTNANAVDQYFDRHLPAFVVLAAGRVAGIVENVAYPAQFMNVNLAIQLNVFNAAHRTGVRKLIFFGSSCMYPRECPQPMAEAALLTGRPEPTSLAYAVAKLAGLQMCLAYNQQFGEKRFIPVIPNSAFGSNDNFDPKSGHVLSALIQRFHQAKTIGAASLTLWGSGLPRREFIHADDVASACLALLDRNTDGLEFPLNIGAGEDYSIQELACKVASLVGYSGSIKWDASKPDGAPRKLLDSSRLRSFGWRPTVNFEQGLRETYQWYLDHALTSETAT